MKYLKQVFTTACVTIGFAACAVTVQETFLQGNEWYAQGDYGTALATYEGIEHKGFGAWYNMGNAAFLQEDYAHALLYWYRAYPGAQGRLLHSLRAHRNLVYQQGTQRVKRYALWYDVLCGYYAHCSARCLQRIIFLLWIIAIACLLALRYRYVRTFSKSALCAWLLVWCFATIGLAYSYYTTVQPIAIVMEPTTVHEGPAEWYARLSMVDKADEVIYLRKHDGWAKILTHDGVGWVFEKTIERVHE